MNEVNNQVTQEKVKKGVNPIVVIILCILFAAVAGVGGWFFGTKAANQEDKKNNDTKVEENKGETKNEENVSTNNGYVEEEILNSSVSNTASYTYVDQQIEVLKFGETNVNMYSKYYIDKETVKVYGDEGETTETYILRRRVYINDKLIGNTHMLGHYETMEEAKKTIRTSYLVESSNPIKDTTLDKYYIVLSVDHIDSVWNGETTIYASDSQYSYIVDEEGNVLKRIYTKYAGAGVVGVYADSEMIKNRNYVTIDKVSEMDYPDDKDYYLFHDSLIELYDNYLYYLNYSDDDMCVFVEKKLTINNSKVVEEVLNEYNEPDDILVAGASC